MSQLAVHRPLEERHVHHHGRLHPRRALARQPGRAREWRRFDTRGVELRTKLGEQLRVEARPDLARKHEVVTLEVTDEKRAEPHARTSWVGEAANHEVLHKLALHLEPVLRSPMLVRRVAPLRDHAFPPLQTRTLPRLR